MRIKIDRLELIKKLEIAVDNLNKYNKEKEEYKIALEKEKAEFLNTNKDNLNFKKGDPGTSMIYIPFKSQLSVPTFPYGSVYGCNLNDLTKQISILKMSNEETMTVSVKDTIYKYI